MKKYIILSLLILFVLSFTGCLIPINIDNENTTSTSNLSANTTTSENTDIVTETTTSSTTTTEQDNSTQEKYSEELYENIEFSVETQDIIDGRQKIVVYIKNNNKNYTFSGTINFEALSINNDILCSDYIYIDDVSPGIETWAILWGKPGSYNSYSVNISEANFRKVAIASNIDYEEIGVNGVFVFIYTTLTNRSELQQIVDVYKNDRFKSQKVFELDFFNDRKKALDAFTNADGVGFGMMLPIATYNYNANTGLDELKLYLED